MELDRKTIAAGETSLRVVVVQQALSALRAKVPEEDLAVGEAAPETEKRLRKLQKQLGVKAGEETLLDEAGHEALEAELKRRDLQVARRSFTVFGSAREADGRSARQQRLLAFDLDLRGVRARADVATLADLDPRHGFTALGETASAADGTYSLTFYEWQYVSAERGAADVVVFALDDEERIVASSQLIHTDDFGDRPARDVDLTLPAPDPAKAETEFAETRASLEPLLKRNGATLAELS